MRRHLLTESSGTVTKVAKPKAGFIKRKGGGEVFHWPSVKIRHVAIKCRGCKYKYTQAPQSKWQKSDGGEQGKGKKYIYKLSVELNQNA